jgi:hypothetical protein
MYLFLLQELLVYHDDRNKQCGSDKNCPLFIQLSVLNNEVKATLISLLFSIKVIIIIIIIIIII